MNKQKAEQHWQQQVDKLQHFAAEKAISQNEIARRTGMSQQAIQRFFKKLFCPTFRVAQQIADAIGYDIQPVAKFSNAPATDDQLQPKFMFTVDHANNELYILHRQFPACLMQIKQETPVRFIIQDLYDEMENPADILNMPFVEEAKAFWRDYGSSLFGGN